MERLRNSLPEASKVFAGSVSPDMAGFPNLEKDDRTKAALLKFLSDAIAVEGAIGAQLRTMAKQRGHRVAHSLFMERLEASRTRRAALKNRYASLGGRRLGAKSAFAAIYGLIPRAVQIGDAASEKAVQNLVAGYSFASGAAAMYSALASVAEVANDAGTGEMALKFQEGEREFATKVWPLIASAARESLQEITRAA